MKKILGINIGLKGFRQEYDGACKELGMDSLVIRARNSCFILSDGTVEFIHRNKTLIPTDFGYTFIRVSGKYTLMTSLIAQFLHFHKVPISDEVYMQHTDNEEKITQMLLFALNNVPIPSTILFTVDGFNENTERIKEHVSFPCVLKTNGSKGKNVWKIDDWEELVKNIAALDTEMAMIQEYIPNNSDIRALYMHGDIIGAIERSSANGFHNNISAGGSASVVDLTKEEVMLSKKACEVLGRSFGGVDIVRTPIGPRFFEVNLGPQIYGFESATKMDVPRELLIRIKHLFFDNNMNKDTSHYIPLGVALGSAIGTALGVVFGNIALGVSLGISMGIVVGTVLMHTQKGR